MKKYPVLALTGPRQSGKTTFLRTHFAKYRYVNLENLDNRNFAQSDPNAFLTLYDKYVIIDEAQRVPQLFSYIQSKVDEDKIMGQYILSGSQNFHLQKEITQSLAGRVIIFKLFPFDIEELSKHNLIQENCMATIQKGFYPALFDKNIPSKVFYSNYIQTYVERDVSDLLEIKNLRLYRNFLALCAARVGQLINLNALANECGISQPTAKAWLSVLENSYILFQLQPYHNNFNKRVSKSAKIYFYDTGLLCYLLKIHDANTLLLSNYKGNIFENYAVAEYNKKNYHNNLDNTFTFWRDAVGHEVDLIWQNDEQLNIVEIKASTTIQQDMFKGLQYFEALAGKLVKSTTLLYAGKQQQNRTFAKVNNWNRIEM